MDSNSLAEVANFFSQLGLVFNTVSSKSSLYKPMTFKPSQVVLRQNDVQKYGYTNCIRNITSLLLFRKRG